MKTAIGDISVTENTNPSQPAAMNNGPFHPYGFQLAMAKAYGGKILNAACGPDPGRLGKTLGATNLDIQRHEDHTGFDFDKEAGNIFVQGSVLDMPFPDADFDTVVLGEFLEHTRDGSAEDAVAECHRVLVGGGALVITVPLDGGYFAELAYRACIADPRGEYVDRISHRHQSWWGFQDDLKNWDGSVVQSLGGLRKKFGFIETVRCGIYYGIPTPMAGFGLVWIKR